jgi:hypothetical protein
VLTRDSNRLESRHRHPALPRDRTVATGPLFRSAVRIESSSPNPRPVGFKWYRIPAMKFTVILEPDVEVEVAA